MSTSTRFLSLLFVLGAVLGQAVPLGANVSPRNGNFYIGYTDVVYPGGLEPKIERVYNSKTPYKGIFGWGWGMDYEVHLKVSADGSVVVHEHGRSAEGVHRLVVRRLGLHNASGRLDIVPAAC